MIGTISPEVARAAVGLRHSHPDVPALQVLDVVMRQRAGRLDDCGESINPGTEFGAIIASAFDRGMAPEDWNLATHPNTPEAVVDDLNRIWKTYVLPKFATRSGLIG